MRDHRARYRGDLLTVTDLPKIINVPEPVQENLEQQQPEQEQQQQQNVDPVIAFLRAEAKRRERIEQEQNDILRTINTIEAEVVRVLPNGNLLVRGIHPPIFRDQGRVKYVVSLQGIVRPSDVDDKNQIPAPRIAQAGAAKNRAPIRPNRLNRRNHPRGKRRLEKSVLRVDVVILFCRLRWKLG